MEKRIKKLFKYSGAELDFITNLVEQCLASYANVTRQSLETVYAETTDDDLRYYVKEQLLF